MALLSDIDWGILLSVAAFFVLGKEGGTVVKQIGRVYGRLSGLKSDLLAEFARAAELPTPTRVGSTSIRQTLLGLDVPTGRASGIPAAVAAPPLAHVVRVEPPAFPYTSFGLGPSTWATTQPVDPAAPGGRT